ncbi:hypothetical protein N7478_008352 [Penicillium angulare]|uniref:uncharacterized protein n=1 Tax=Penicillium angulare TaxID=116970 RepID=UPI0025418ABA|nr:uncharacterized protein N7478_008352 [Penicillium angulare]KAJ5273227.1 hypothetical protein N7478_008352 [Penicillium angulare]
MEHSTIPDMNMDAAGELATNPVENNGKDGRADRMPLDGIHSAYPVEVPSTFPDLVLTDDELRQAFYFRPCHCKQIDPSRVYWRPSSNRLLRNKYHPLLFETEETADGTIQYRHSKKVFHTNTGSKWEGIRRGDHDPERYNYLGVPRPNKIPDTDLGRQNSERHLQEPEPTFQRPEPKAKLEYQALEEPNEGSAQVYVHHSMNADEAPLPFSDLHSSPSSCAFFPETEVSAEERIQTWNAREGINFAEQSAVNEEAIDLQDQDEAFDREFGQFSNLDE